MKTDQGVGYSDLVRCEARENFRWEVVGNLLEKLTFKLMPRSW